MKNNRTQQPNIIFITTDQLRWDFYDNSYVKSLNTPNISRLMQEGAVLTNAVSNCPICIPTRFTWVHGIYASQGAANLMKNCHDWPKGLDSMPKALNKAGYYTALIGKLHSHEGLYRRDVSNQETLNETKSRGFDYVYEVCGKSLSYWFDCNWTHYLEEKGLADQYRADLRERLDCSGGYEPYHPSFLEAEDCMDGFIGRHICEWIKDYNEKKPLFLHASYCGPHFPIDPPKLYFDRYKPEDMPVPEGIKDPEKIRLWQEGRAAYCAAIEFIDDEIGKLLTVVEAKGMTNDTLIVFGTDHGEMIGHKDLKGKKPFFDTSVRTPYIVWQPGKISPGQVLTAPVEAVDVPATFMDAAGLGPDPSAHIDSSPGKSFLGYVYGESPAPRSWGYSETDEWRMVREADWKYAVTPSGDHLYDMKNDPWEDSNLIDDPTQQVRVQRMQRQLIKSLCACVRPNNIVTKPRDDWWKREAENRHNSDQ